MRIIGISPWRCTASAAFLLLTATVTLFHTTDADDLLLSKHDGAFPQVVTLTASREVVKTYGPHWQLLKGETIHISNGSSILSSSSSSTVNSPQATLQHHSASSFLNVSLLVDHPLQLEQLLSLQEQGDLITLATNEVLTKKHLPPKLKQHMLRRHEKTDTDNNRDLQSLNAEDKWTQRGFSDCYPTVEQTFALLEEWANETYPEWVRLDVIGESYLKSIGDPDGWDIPVAILDVPSNIPTEEKAPLIIVAGHHSRELSPPLTVLRWFESLMESYGTDADVTWMLNRTIIHMVPIVNPDGRVIVQNNLDWMYRKNAQINRCRGGAEFTGTDLNRNYPLFWGGDFGSSDDPCSSSYRGEGPLSAPESSAIFEYAGKIFDDDVKKGTAEEATEKLNEACDEEFSGLFIDVHAAGDFIYYPWGYGDVWPPNNSSILSMASKLAYYGDYKLWGPGSDDFLYPVSGDASDATYGQFCINSMGYELGTQFYETCEDWDALVKPVAFASFTYAAKTVYKSYKLPQGPDILSIDAPATMAATESMWSASVLASDEEMTRFESQNIASVKVYVDIFPVDEGAEGIDMVAGDGVFDAKSEVAIVDLDTSSWPVGRHIVYFQAMDVDGYVGPVSAVFVEKEGGVVVEGDIIVAGGTQPVSSEVELEGDKPNAEEGQIISSEGTVSNVTGQNGDFPVVPGTGVAVEREPNASGQGVADENDPVATENEGDSGTEAEMIPNYGAKIEPSPIAGDGNDTESGPDIEAGVSGVEGPVQAAEELTGNIGDTSIFQVVPDLVKEEEPVDKGDTSDIEILDAMITNNSGASRVVSSFILGMLVFSGLLTW